MGSRTPGIDKLLDRNWISNDTLISVDPLTMEESVSASVNDLSPDTLVNGEIIFQIAEYMPVFAGCDTALDAALCTQQQLSKFVSTRLEYPRWAKVRGLEGSAVATFLIDAEGRVKDTGIASSLGDDFDRRILALVDQMPLWHPGFHDGEPVAVRYRLPVTFSLPKD